MLCTWRRTEVQPRVIGMTLPAPMPLISAPGLTSPRKRILIPSARHCSIGLIIAGIYAVPEKHGAVSFYLELRNVRLA